MDYSRYKVEDFVLDPAFREWVLHPSASSNVFWENWINGHPDKLDEIRDARALLLSLARVDYDPPEEMENEIWRNIDMETSALVPEERDVVPLNPSSIIERYPNRKSRAGFVWLYSAVAASIILAVALFSYLNLIEIYSPNIDKVEVYLKENSKGQKSTILLSDGTKILLNAESSIEYTSDYNASERRVLLKGEAFFEVAKDPDRPFVVQTNALSTTALGTSFNVSAYEETLAEVVLFTGKVKVESAVDISSSVVLIPGEKVSLTQNRELDKEKVDLLNEALWKDGVIYFKDTELTKALSDLERWYGVDISVKNQKNEDIFLTGRFDNESLVNVLRSLSYTTDFTYDIQNKNVTIKF